MGTGRPRSRVDFGGGEAADPGAGDSFAGAADCDTGAKA